MSLLLRPQVPADQVHRPIFAAAVAVADSVRDSLPQARVEIKWPNDVLIDGRKTSGINLPVQLAGSRITSAVLGIGINVNTRREDFPDELRAIATSLLIAGGQELDRVAFGEAFLSRLEAELDRVRAGEFEAVLDAWRKSFKMTGSAVAVGGPGIARPIEGVVRGIDAEGALLLETETRVERILAGDVTTPAKGG